MKGILGIFVGYAADHSGAVYRMYCPGTRSIRLSRDITWLNKSYGTYKSISDDGVVKYEYNDDKDST